MSNRLGSPDQIQKLGGEFGTEDIPFLKAISAKQLYAVLDRTRIRRNEWDAHGGIANQRVQRLRLAELENDLGEFQQRIGDTFVDHLLLKPVSTVYEDGVHINVVKSLTGSHSDFTEEKVSTRAPLDHRYLYFTHRHGYKALQLLPFVQMMESPQGEENACYFYSRWNPKGRSVRWVSFHFGGEPDRELPGDLLGDILRSLPAFTNQASAH